MRWIAIFPIPIFASVIIYFLNMIVDSFNPLPFSVGMPTALVAAFATVAAAAGYVLVGVTIAPAFRHLVGVALAGVVVLLCGFLLGNFFTGNTPNTTATNPRWYDMLLIILAAAGAIGSSIYSFEMKDQEGVSHGKKFLICLPSIIRWITFLPIGAIMALLIIVPEVLVNYFTHVDMKLILLENHLIMSLVFIAIATVIAPKGKALVGIVLASLWGAWGLVEIFSAAFRPLISSWLEHKYGWEVAAYDPIWYKILQGIAMVSSSVIVSIGAIEASKKQKAVYAEKTS